MQLPVRSLWLAAGALLAPLPHAQDAERAAAPADERFAPAATYAAADELAAYLKRFSSWPVHVWHYEGRDVLLFVTGGFPARLASSYVLAVHHLEGGRVDVLDHGFLWRTESNRSLHDMAYDFDRRIVYLRTDYGDVLGGAQLDLGIAREGLVRGSPLEHLSPE